MIDSMAQRIASFLVDRGAVAPEDADVQIYGLQVLLSTSMNLIFALLLSLAVGQLLFGASLLATFMLLRRFTGGYHSHSYGGCFLSLQVMMLLGFGMRYALASPSSSIFVYGLLISSLLLVFFLAPIDHVNKPSTPASRLKFRDLSRVLVCVLAAAAATGCSYVGPAHWVLGITMGLLATATLLVVAKLQKKGGALS